jgi:hypothetical protein
MRPVSWREDKQIDETAPMLPVYFWLFPAWPLLIASQTLRVAAAAFGPPRATAEVIPFPAHRSWRRATPV